jgi:hypothetical protein
MTVSEEAYRKVIAEGLAKWTLRGIAGIFSLGLTVFLLGYPIIAAAILVLAVFLTVLLAAYVFGWIKSYGKMRSRVAQLEKRLDEIDAEKKSGVLTLRAPFFPDTQPHKKP